MLIADTLVVGAQAHSKDNSCSTALIPSQAGMNRPWHSARIFEILILHSSKSGT